MKIITHFEEVCIPPDGYIWLVCHNCYIRKIEKNGPITGIANCVKCGCGRYVDLLYFNQTKILCA